MKNPASIGGKIFLAILGATTPLAFSQLPTNVTVETFYNTSKVNLRGGTPSNSWTLKKFPASRNISSSWI